MPSRTLFGLAPNYNNTWTRAEFAYSIAFFSNIAGRV
jgi:hypothetical protein